jgi:hypothetical protein
MKSIFFIIWCVMSKKYASETLPHYSLHTQKKLSKLPLGSSEERIFTEKKVQVHSNHCIQEAKIEILTLNLVFPRPTHNLPQYFRRFSFVTKSNIICGIQCKHTHTKYPCYHQGFHHTRFMHEGKLGGSSLHLEFPRSEHSLPQDSEGPAKVSR